MREKTGDIWTSDAQAIVITTNGVIRKNGELVMGRGIAAEALSRDPLLAHDLGRWVRNNGNVPTLLSGPQPFTYLISLPTKEDWRDKSRLSLIVKSLELMLEIVNGFPVFGDGPKIESVALPRPGCGNGGLDWYSQVRPLLIKTLDDRFCVWSK